MTADAKPAEKKREKRTIQEIRDSKKTGEKMVYMSVPDYTSAQWAEMAGVDVAVVGDSLAMIAHGHPSTIPASMDMMVMHAQAIRRGAPNTFVLGCMPYQSYNTVDRALANSTRFMQDAAHELRTPMAAIRLQIENLRGHVPAGDAAERFAQLEGGVERAQHLIEQLLRLSRQEGSPPAVRGPVDVSALLRDSVGQLMVLADQRRIDVGFEGRVAPLVSAPPSELRSVFDNLIDNAVRYAPEGGVVDVRLHMIDGQPVVDVLDDGPGIPPEQLERVFDRFVRVAGAPAGGSGLGLAIARAAALRNGLRIVLANRADGPGLLARVYLPASS